MYLNRAVEITSANQHRFQSFIVFEPASSRINQQDILLQGDDVRNLYERIAIDLSRHSDLKHLTLQNRLTKIGQMMDLLVVYDNVILTKFFDRIWRRYSAISNIGEQFLDYPTFMNAFPEYEKQKSTLLAQRIDDDDDDSDTSEDDDSSSDDKPTSELSSDEASEKTSEEKKDA